MSPLARCLSCRWSRLLPLSDHAVPTDGHHSSNSSSPRPDSGIKSAAYGGADVVGLCTQVACPLGLAPLAARGLSAVLARAGPAGGVGHCTQRQRSRWLHWLVPDFSLRRRFFIPAASVLNVIAEGDHRGAIRR